jgi:hypothetical protein
MATPTVTGGAALYIASHRGVRPGQVRAALRHVASMDWKTATDPDGRPDPLLDVHAFDDPPTFALDRPAEVLQIGRGGRLEVPIDIHHQNGHTHSIALSAEGLPSGIAASFRDGSDGARMLVLRAADDLVASDVTMTVRGTDGELSRTLAVDFRVVGGDRITFADAARGPLVVTPSDPIPVAFTESHHAADPDPAGRSVQRQWALAVTPGSCDGVAWRDQGDPVDPDDLDQTDPGDETWSFAATGLPRDGCYRWLVSLIDGAGASAAWVSRSALVDGTAPRAPGVLAAGSHAWQGVANGTVWVRGGSGALQLTATDRDRGSGTVTMRFGPLTRTHGWSYSGGDRAVADGVASAGLHWSSTAKGSTALTVTGTDAVGLDGAGRVVTISIDARAPSSAAWSTPSGFRMTYLSPELRWRSGADRGSGWATDQRIQQQRARVAHAGRCTGLIWANDGAARLMSSPNVATGLISGYCYRWRITSLDRVGNRGATRTSGVVLFDARAPRGDFVRADEGTLRIQAGSTYRLRWTEQETGGSGGVTRALERERKTLAPDGSCSGRLWRQDGPTRHVRSGYTATGLEAGYCYRWRLVLQDRAYNVTTAISGIVARQP